jgi:putative transposase
MYPDTVNASDDQQWSRKGLSRLAEGFYQGRATVFWTYVVQDRAVGWLTEGWHLKFGEILLHSCYRYGVLCPVYVIMPDHVHLVLQGVTESADQLNCTSFLRGHIRPDPHVWQMQAYDHVLRETERVRGAFQRSVQYVLNNPQRKGFVTNFQDWPYSGCVVPGSPRLDPRRDVFWTKYWERYAEFLGGGI